MATRFSEKSLVKLTASSLDPDYALSMGVRPVTRREDLPEEFSEVTPLCPVPGMLFPWRHVTDPDQIVWQYRPDVPVDEPYKYVFPAKQHRKVALVRAARSPGVGGSHRVAIVEGTLQSLAFARHAPDDVTVLSIPGCWGWSENQSPTPELATVDGHPVVVFLDADAETNHHVYQAGRELARSCVTYGATDPVMFGRIPMRGKSGVDDFLATVAEGKRAEMVDRLMSGRTLSIKPADTKPVKPKAPRSVLGLATAAGLIDVNDTSLGTTWSEDHVNEFRWLTDQESWLGYRDGRWDRVGATVVGNSVGRYLDDVCRRYVAAAERENDGEKRDKLEETGRQLLTTAKILSVRTRVAMHDVSQTTQDALDQHPTLWCAANCLIDLSTGTVSAHDPDLLLTTGSDVPYDPEARCPRFDRFLTEVLPETEVREYVMRVFAMAMLGQVREHVLPVLIGEGRNGKGTLIRIMHGVFGSHGHVINPKSLLVRKFEAHEQEIAQLAGRRLVTGEETTKGSQWDVGRINEWTGGNILKGRFMNQNEFNFVPSHTLVLATNHRPSVGDGERAFWARYREIPFEVSFEGREDFELEPHILTYELPGVLNRLMEAGAQYRELGRLAEPAAVIAATDDAKVEADHLFQFATEMVENTENHESHRITNTDLYDGMIKWWAQNARGEAPPGPRAFGRAMRLALGMPADAKNPRKFGKGADCRLTWTGVHWRGEVPITPLSQDRLGGLPIRVPDSPRSADLSSGNDLTDSGHSSTNVEVSADTAPRSAARSADPVDHESVITAGESLGTAWSAESASKVVGGSVSGKKVPEKCDNRGSSLFTPIRQISVDTDRQTRHTEQTEAPANGSVSKIRCRTCIKIISADGAARHDGRCGRCSKINTPPWN